MGGCCGKRQESDSEDSSLETVNENQEIDVSNDQINENGLQAFNVIHNEVKPHPIEQIFDPNLKHINSLTDFDLIKIFKKLDFDSKITAQSVCQRWNRLIGEIFDEQKYLILSINEIDSNFHWETDWVDLRRDTNKSVVSLRIIGNDCFTHKIIPFIISKHKRIHTLYLRLSSNYLQWRRDSMISHTNIFGLITESCNKNLSNIRIEYLKSHSLIFNKVFLNHEDVKNVVHKFENIVNFQIDADSIYMSEKSIQLMFKVWDNIKSFKLNALSFNSENDYSYSTFSGYCFENLNTNIEKLSINFDLMSVNVLSILANKGMSKLKHFEYSSDDLSSFSLIGECFKSLKTFCFSKTKTRLLNETNMILIFETISKLINLENLSFSKCYNSVFRSIIIKEDLVKFLKNCKNLRKINFYSINIDGKFTKELSKCVPQLELLFIEKIGLSGSLQLFSEGIEHLKNLKFLKISFNMYSENHLTDYELIAIINSCDLLEYIDVSKCDLISGYILHTLFEFANRKPNQIITVLVDSHLKRQIETHRRFTPKNIRFN